MSEKGLLSERENRLRKLKELKALGIHPYPERFEKEHTLSEVLSKPVGTPVKSAGRLIRSRRMGKITFSHLQDYTARVQVIFKQDLLGEKEYKIITSLLDLGDFIGVEGEVFVTKTGEVSILVKRWQFLGKALRPIPEKYHGLRDKELLYRKRYLDLIANRETMERFLFRSKVVKTIREFYWEEGFIEVETPVLMHKATGANARPYWTHNNALDIDVVLRISHELPLKELIVGGFEKIFELGKAFRNEGQSPAHLPEHTHLEHYAAYWNYEDNILFTEKMFNYLFEKLGLEKQQALKDREGRERLIDFTTPWKRINFTEMVCKASGLDIMSYEDADVLRADLKKRGIEFEDMDKMGLGTLIDNIYKKLCRPKIIQPTILYDYPKVVQPLARVSDKDPRKVDQFQLVVNGWELVKAYSELVDPVDQRERFAEQAKARALGDEEAMEVDEEYIEAMEHGMPPISGWGMGVDRLVCLLTKQDNLRDVVLMPLMRPES